MILAVSNQHSVFSQTTGLHPLPTGQLKGKNRAEIDHDLGPEKTRKRASTAF
jgi:hypothetical protein